jgi:osmotically inducible protein OsmC
MADIERTASAVWQGDLRKGSGQISSTSGVIQNTPYTYATRFENEPGTNPEELIAAAHAACFSMAFANTLAKQGYQPERIETRATCIMVSVPEGGHKIVRMRLVVRGRVPGIDEATFRRVAQEADQGCPVSNLLRCGLEIQHDVSLM